MPLGVGRRVQKVWGRLVACRPNNEGVLLRPRGVVMVGWGVWPIFVTREKPSKRDVTNRHQKAMSVHVPTYVRSCIFTWWCHMLMSSLFYSSLNITPNFLIKVIASGVRNNGNMLFKSF
jgi:hypothetical protein